MQKSFTLEDLAKYSFEVYKETHRTLAKTMSKEGPGPLAIRNILNYSKALTVNESSSGDPFFLLLN